MCKFSDCSSIWKWLPKWKFSLLKEPCECNLSYKDRTQCIGRAFAQEIYFCLQNVFLFLKINLLSLCNIIPLKINSALYPCQRNSLVLITSHVAWGRLPDMGHFQFLLAGLSVLEQSKGRVQHCGPKDVERWWEPWPSLWAARTPALRAWWQIQGWLCPQHCRVLREDLRVV